MNTVTDHERRLAELLEVALAEPPDARERALRGRCDDDALVQEVLALIQQDSLELDSLSGSPFPVLDSLQGMEDPVGTVIGPYVIEEELGRGGMGVVYSARQTEPVERRVAIKLAGSHLQRARDRERFASERRTLARLTHPNIAQLFEAGVTGTGRPYFVMELVDGEPITEFCDRRRLGLAERLRVFHDACAAVEHAHSRQTLHRDLKPANVLVSSIGERHVVKVIDFGIATVLDLEDDAVPASGSVVGTPAYLSPEALRGDEIDNRVDVYSLGVVLYELICGRLPTPRAGRSVAALLDDLTNRDPDPPSRVLEASGLAREAAETRGASAQTLLGTLRRDLDWVALRAIARDPGQRYASVRELAADVERFLQGKPVAARPGDRLYRLYKFVGRHRAASLAGLLVAGLSIAAVTLYIRYTLDLHRARSETEAARQQAERMVNFLLDDLYDALALTGSRSVLQTVAERANAYFEELPPALAQASAIQHARALRNLARVHLQRGENAEAQRLIEAAFSLDRSASDGSPRGRSIEALAGLAGDHRGMGDVLARFGRREEALASVRQAIELRRRVLDLLPDSVEAQGELAYDLGELGWALRNTARLSESADAFGEATRLLERIVETEPTRHWRRQLLASYRELGGALRMARGPGSGLDHNRRSVELAEELLVESPEDSELLLDAGASWIALSLQERETGASADAVVSNQTGIDRIRRWTRIDPDSTYAREYLAYGHLQLASSLTTLGAADEARAEQLRVLELVRTLPDALSAQVLEVEALLLLGRIDEARPLVPRLIEGNSLANRPQLRQLIEDAGLDPGT